MPAGYQNKIFTVDLSDRTITEEVFPEETLKQFLGGSGLAAKILYDRTDESTDPLGPKNPLIYMTGPFVGTPVPFSGRHHVTAKSPLTGIFGESDVGGRWGTALKKAGIDGLIIEGKANSPVYLFIHNRQIEFLDAQDVWGLDTYQTHDSLTAKHGKHCQVSCIGPAGERQILLANIAHDGRSARMAGRAGLGAVMGSKNLKALVVEGDLAVPVAEKDALMAYIRSIMPKIKDNTKGLSVLGTAVGVLGSESIGDLPLKNWKQGGWKEQAQRISGERMAETILHKRYYCGACPVGCGREVKISEGPYSGVEGAGPEYETLGMLGACCLVDDLEAVAYANELCNRFGLDTISTGSVIAFAMELYEHRMLPAEDLDGIKPEWGSAEAVIALIRKIAEQEGIGQVLGQGVKKAAEQIGGLAHEFAIHVKGLELPAHDPRSYNSLAVGYATSNRGACHLQGASYFFEKTATMPEVGYNEPQDRKGVEGKGRLNYHAQNIMCLLDSLKLCKFGLYGKLNLTDLTRFIHDVIGWNMSVAELLETGERIFTLKRLYNIRCGISRKDDTLPPRILSQPRRDEGSGDNVPPLGRMLNEYYQIRGWNDEGIPTPETLERLRLGHLAA